ncbi:1466_t:CDS:2, partial [Scutellospora calospora]
KIESSDELGAKEHNIWRKYDNNTNSAELAHALVNKEGKQLKLLSAILQRRYDERLLKIKQTYKNSGIPYTRNDKSKVKRQQTAANRNATRYKSTNAIEVTEMELMNNAESISMVQNNSKNNSFLDIKLEERKIALLERQTRVRKEAAEVEAIELQNQQLKASL